MDNLIIDLFEKLDLTEDASDVFEVASEYFDSLGFDAINIGLASASDETFFGGFSSMCPDFIRYYIEQRYPLIDPHLRYCHDNESERICDLKSNLRLPHTQSKAVQTLLYEAQEAGQMSSLLVPRQSLVSDRVVAFNLVSSAESSDLVARYQQDRNAILVGVALIQTAILEAMEGGRFGEFWYPVATNGVQLSVREREVLKWLASGMRVDQIADVLGIANATVNFHIQGLKKKLGARTREQAVAMALRQRIL